MTDVELSDGVVRLRQLRYSDVDAWDRLRASNREWLGPWEASSPEVSGQAPTFRQYVRRQKRAARAGTDYSLGVLTGQELIGHLTVSAVTWGSLRSAVVGYWVGLRFAGRGYIPRAVALVGDYCFFELGLHRIEINIRPENQASLRVVEKLGFRDEGLRERLIHINGQWCDHRSFALTREEIGDGLVARLAQR